MGTKYLFKEVLAYTSLMNESVDLLELEIE